MKNIYLLFVIFLFAVVSLLLGEVPLAQALDSFELFIQVRLPRLLTAVVVGGLLSLSGLFLQSVFKNELAEPHLLGTQGGSSVGIVLWLILSEKYPLFLSIGPTLPSFFGGLIITLILMLFLKRKGGTEKILLVGVLLSSFVATVLTALSTQMTEQGFFAYFNWGHGHFERPYYFEITVMFASLLALYLCSIKLRQKFDLLLFDSTFSLTIDINYSKVIFYAVFFACFASSLTTAFCGPIGLIGLIAPHIARLINKTELHQRNITTSILIGATLSLLMLNISLLSDWLIKIPFSSVSGLLSFIFMTYLLFYSKRKNTQGGA